MLPKSANCQWKKMFYIDHSWLASLRSNGVLAASTGAFWHCAGLSNGLLICSCTDQEVRLLEFSQSPILNQLLPFRNGSSDIPRTTGTSLVLQSVGCNCNKISPSIFCFADFPPPELCYHSHSGLLTRSSHIEREFK